MQSMRRWRSTPAPIPIPPAASSGPMTRVDRPCASPPPSTPSRCGPSSSNASRARSACPTADESPMSPRWTRIIAAVAVFIGVVVAGGIQQTGELDPITFAYHEVADVLALILAVALIVAIAAYLLVEWLQTPPLDPVRGQ